MSDDDGIEVQSVSTRRVGPIVREQMSIRKVYRKADGSLRPGPWHTEARYGLTWCGVRLRGVQIFRVPIPHEIQPDEKLCDACRVAQERGRPRPWRRSR